MRDGYSLSDIAAASGNNNGGLFGGNGAWLIIILFLFVFCGWGNGFGNNGNNGGGGSVLTGYTLASDFATIQRQLSDGFSDLTSQSRYIQNGLCDGFYNMNTSLLNGFAGVNNSITTNGYETRNAIQTLMAQLSTCCCNIEKGQMETNYLNAQNTCSINNTIQNTGRDTLDAINNMYNNLHNEIVANRIEDKNAQIAAQQNEINALRLSASQSAQNAYLINQLNPCPTPSYIVPNPNCCYSSCNATVI